MNGSILRNKLLKNRTKIDKLAYIKPGNLYLSPVTKTKKEYQQNVVENKYFLKSLKHLFSNESSNFSKLVKNDMFLNHDDDILPVLHNVFANFVSSLNVSQHEDQSAIVKQFQDPVLKLKINLKIILE